MERIKNTIYKMVMECLETSLPLSIKADPEIYVELTNTIITKLYKNSIEGNQRNTQNYHKLMKFIRLENTYMQIRVLK